MRRGVVIGQPVVYRGTEHAGLRGGRGIVLEVLSARLILVAFDLPDGRQPVKRVPPEDVGISEADAARFLEGDRAPWRAPRSPSRG